ncbi:MAG: pyrimidine operon attenuation protein / uracil phosphoribosyltransferase [Azoarcus sp.]|uniref:Pyrimidine operon attenuation protein / uracil phosphoribosyltransferase n=1 Tax=Aromatoleum tolulyticum TaxID=34027 RepID=A0A1N7ATT9_9RHOO|nr:phosphoribosyltransferase family protein [Aromatoleum tolulyticum]MCK9986394.1 pyrimidine operon attenuation protein / uracil phosphoribosyltransferase [Azoarcus sp.]SIR42423.1 pyrimidine operon attenuation protein / uracil phosphoribosyltransferase [Aromatoleum tolulyticum]
MERPHGLRTCLYDETQLELVLAEMAQGLVTRLDRADPVAVVGILRRGAPLADRLVAALQRHHGLPAPLRLDLGIKRYEDDLTLLHPETRLEENEEQRALDLQDYTVVVVDDVLYTGNSMLRAVAWLAQKQPRRILVVTLADRCVTRLPIHADVVGVRLQVAPPDVVECNVPPYEPTFRIELLKLEPADSPSRA